MDHTHEAGEGLHPADDSHTADAFGTPYCSGCRDTSGCPACMEAQPGAIPGPEYHEPEREGTFTPSPLKPEPVIDWADGYPAWVLDGDRVYACIPVSLVMDAVQLGHRARTLTNLEEAGERIRRDAWEDIDTERAEVVRRLAEFGADRDNQDRINRIAASED